MPTFKINKAKGYTVMSNYHLRDKNMSLKAKGLLSLILSLPDDWNYSINGFVAICKESNTAVVSALNELKTLGYMKIDKVRKENGTFEYIYNIYEKPIMESPNVESPTVEKPHLENPCMDNVAQLNTKELNTKELNTNKLNTKKRTVEEKEKIKKEKSYYPLDEKLNKAFADFVENRKAIKKPMTDIAIDRAIKKLDSLTRDPDEKIEILNQSIIGRWTGLYPLKKERTSSGSAYIDAINNRLDCVDEWAQRMKKVEGNEY